MNTEQPDSPQPKSSFFYFTSLESFEKWYELLLALEQINQGQATLQARPD
ncbi:hypothetical protein RY831_23265 [Noviherbaspirillum sp. CPCC 100848]|uniref:Uncharacterized protein n=1 Tax=Noviherbaspirillum album TaxID=3080276 RepID=A0ABU6JEK3_9BURK|nr:hypothetical protein [Noviherbaspirillum sp. CPCC 100848]MEC4722093.1 hypothetical protein [Noviherbaspirillum sp. CPCC 100848]